MNPPTIRFIRRGEAVSLANVPPDRTLLDLLREDIGCTGTKEGCGEGDCGACTVVLGERRVAGDGSATLEYRAINSCIRLAHSVDGLALWTVEDLAAEDGTLHPAQQAMVDCHGSQCGFCTPGFVMSLFGMYQNQVCRGHAITPDSARRDLSGNLCRCTGYRPIFDAAERMASLPARQVDESALLKKLELLAGESSEFQKQNIPKITFEAPVQLSNLLILRAAHPAAQLVAGCTDVGLWITKQHRQFDAVIDVTRVAELRRIDAAADGALRIGAAATLTEAFDALVAGRPELTHFARRFAGLPVRNSGTLGGNVANGSPIGDSMPLLIALGAQVVLASVRGERSLLLEDFYTGYRQTLLAPDEVVAFIDVPAPGGELLRAYKVSKRFDDDISAVCLVLNLKLDDGVVAHASIGAGGVAATPVRAVRTEAALQGQPWTAATVQQARAALQAEFQPISDMRASAGYRSTVLGNLLQRCWLESQGLQAINLESFVLDDDAAAAPAA